jgi:hypothetical protein
VVSSATGHQSKILSKKSKKYKVYRKNCPKEVYKVIRLSLKSIEVSPVVSLLACLLV